MESQRSLLIIGLLLVSFLLWIEYQEATAPQAPQTEVNPSTTQTLDAQADAGIPSADNIVTDASSSEYIPTDLQDTAVAAPSVITSESGRYIDVFTDTLHVKIDLVGGDVVEGDLVQYPVTQGENDSYGLLSPTIAVNYNIQNNSANALQMQQFAQLKQTLNEQKGGGSMFMPTFRGAAYGTQDDIYEKLKFDNIEDEKLRVATVGGWTGMLEHYFVSAWIPPQEQTNTLYARIVQNTAIIGYTGESVVINSGDTAVINSQLYVGPKDQDVLKELAEGLNLTVDYGILWWLALPLFSLLQLIQSVVINWGLAIIIITLIVKGAMYWLTKKQYESMAKMRNLAPKMQQLKDRYGEDRQKMSQAMMELYKKEKVNPMGGCFPIANTHRFKHVLSAKTAAYDYSRPVTAKIIAIYACCYEYFLLLLPSRISTLLVDQ